MDTYLGQRVLRVLVWTKPGLYSPSWQHAYAGWVWELDNDALAGVYLATVEMAQRITVDIVEEA